EWKAKYGDLLQQLSDAYAGFEPYTYSRDYFNEIGSKIELMSIAATLNTLVTALNKDEASYTKAKEEALKNLEETFKEYNAEVDKKMFATLAEMYIKDQKPIYVSPWLQGVYNNPSNAGAAG